MRTLGIDLASRPKKTAICEIEWCDDASTVTIVRLDVSDEVILDQAVALRRAKAERDVDYAIGIDAPFGWPVPFIEFVTRSPASNRPLPRFNPERAKLLKFRLEPVMDLVSLGDEHPIPVPQAVPDRRA
jgi:hypothetical protein